MKNKSRSINFLRGVPADDVLSNLIPFAAAGYKKAIEEYKTDVLQYGHFNGFEPLRKLIADMHQVDPARVVVGNGGMEVISLFFKSLPPGSTVAIEETTYDRVVFDAQRYGHKLIGVELTPTGIDPAQLAHLADRQSVQAFYGIPFHQNPSGINYSPETIADVQKVCKDRDVICAWDICYEPLRYDGNSNTPIELSEWGPILISSFTKTIAPGTKCGYIILPESRISDMMHVVANTRINPNLPTQAFIADFIASGEYEKFLKDTCGFYRPRMDALNQSLSEHFSGAYPAEMTGGFFSCLTFEHIPVEKETAFINAAREAGVGIASAWDAVAPNFRDEKKQNGVFIRLTFPAYPAELIQWGISTLKQVTDTF